MPLSCALTCCAPWTLEGVPPPPLSSPPDWLITIRATITASAAKPPMIRYWMRRFRASGVGLLRLDRLPLGAQAFALFPPTFHARTVSVARTSSRPA